MLVKAYASLWPLLLAVFVISDAISFVFVYSIKCSTGYLVYFYTFKLLTKQFCNICIALNCPLILFPHIYLFIFYNHVYCNNHEAFFPFNLGYVEVTATHTADYKHF